MEFALDGWHYDQPHQTDVLSDGGKAHGLRLCEQIAEGSARFYVPPWFGAGWKNDYVADELQGWIRTWLAEHRPWAVIVRSSGDEEDWFDGRSGTDHSNVIRPDEASIKRALRERIERGDLPVVVQSMEDGYGCVIDVGWSAILGKVVVRVAVGGVSQEGGGERYTSATWDNEARFGLYDANTGEAIIELADHSLGPTMPEAVTELVTRLRAIGIDYGVQLEAVIHPRFPNRWNLVQLRPSPDVLRGTVAMPPCDGTLVMASCRVSKPGVCEGETVVLGNRDDKHREVIHLAMEIARIEGGEFDRDLGIEKEERALVAGKIVLWLDSMVPKTAESVYRALGVARLGAAGQISVRPLVNSSHGTSSSLARRGGGDLGAKASAAKAASIIVGTPKNHGTLFSAWPRDAWPRTPVRLRIVSDGLYGEVRQLP